MYREIDRFRNVCFITSIQRLQKHIPEEVHHWEQGIESGTILPQARYLLSKTKEDVAFTKKIPRGEQYVKFLPCDKTIDMDFSVYRNKVALTAIEDELFVVVIESVALYRSLKTIFDILWHAR